MLKSKGPKSLKTSKAPGNDGFTPIYYKKFAGTLAPKLSKLLNYILQGHKLPEEMLHDNMILISKPNKDQSVPQNYRLILVLNNDLKNLGRLLADRLVSIISSLVAPEQTGFIPSSGRGEEGLGRSPAWRRFLLLLRLWEQSTERADPAGQSLRFIPLHGSAQGLQACIWEPQRQLEHKVAWRSGHSGGKPRR